MLGAVPGWWLGALGGFGSVCVRDGGGPDGTATNTAQALPADQAAAAYERLDRLARAVKRAGHTGSLDEIRADLCLGLLDGSLHHLSEREIIACLLGAGSRRIRPKDGRR
ncbi:hypothetical protein [Pseudonocardia acaciae]|uniref:hypothetical protein n=1 Tax=Pseudonocardia acaciae TaxID=551276 RepID=UPI00048E1029|nr:hypothetical protein [Pseudonocardia acaciae]